MEALFGKSEIDDEWIVRRLIALLLVVIGTLSSHGGVFAASGLNASSGSEDGLSAGLYFAVVTWSTLGYGDLTPLREGRLFAMSLAPLGVTANGFIVGLIFAALSLRVRARTD